VANRDTRERLTLTVEEAAQVLGIGRTLAYEAVKRGDIPTVRIGRRLLVPQVAIAQLLSDQRVGPASSESEATIQRN
jgi:excisionase family DNA binding protein